MAEVLVGASYGPENESPCLIQAIKEQDPWLVHKIEVRADSQHTAYLLCAVKACALACRARLESDDVFIVGNLDTSACKLREATSPRDEVV